jgi:mitofusin
MVKKMNRRAAGGGGAAAAAAAANGAAGAPDDDDESPLRLFSVAKEKINCLYQDLGKCVNKANQFYTNGQLESEILEHVDTDKLRRLTKSIETIQNVLSRNHMKVAFFGHTSNGKSTVINAILHDNVLPRGYGVTTKCFLQIQGTHDSEAHVLVQKKGQPEEKKPISFVTQMANALNRNSLECSTLLKIFWPISKCSLLKHDVVFVDSPGVNVDENLDEWIDDYCHDADVFVLVSSSESTLNIAEKNFFHKVSEKLSKPNIFILNNRFDIIDQNEPDSMDQVREQHVERAVDFLSQELKISTRDEAKERTFFVSAKETLSDRCPMAAATGGFDSKTLKGYKQRGQEFQNFERKFEESLSKSAVKTKFMKHCEKGRETINELTSILNSTKSLVSRVSEQKLKELQICHERQKRIETIFYANEKALQNQIFEIKKSIQAVSDVEFDNEIRRLARLVDEFDLEFSVHPIKLQAYKEQLYLHVEECLSENLRARINIVISKHVNPFNKIMCDMSTLLSDERHQMVKNLIVSQSYVQDDLFDLRIYKQFYSEFQEDLEFRFSLGLVSIIRKFQSKFSAAKPVSMNNSLDQATMRADTDIISIFERFMMNPPQSQTTIGSLAVGGVLVRTVGWKVIVITTVVYGALYAFEYLTWTNSAKERTFKAQYVRYAKKGLQDCVPIISQHIANSVEQKMAAIFDKLKAEVNEENKSVSSRTTTLRSSLDKLRVCEEFTNELLASNNVLMNELVAFAASFLN